MFKVPGNVTWRENDGNWRKTRLHSEVQWHSISQLKVVFILPSVRFEMVCSVHQLLQSSPLLFRWSIDRLGRWHQRRTTWIMSRLSNQSVISSASFTFAG